MGEFEQIRLRIPKRKGVKCFTVLSLALAVLMRSHVAAQIEGIEKLFTERAINCADVLANCSKLVPEYYSAGKLDTAQALVDYWQSHCGDWEPFDRLSLLMPLARGESIGGGREQAVFASVFSYQNQLQCHGSYTLWQPGFHVDDWTHCRFGWHGHCSTPTE